LNGELGPVSWEHMISARSVGGIRIESKF